MTTNRPKGAVKEHLFKNLDIIVPFALYILLLVVIVCLALDDTPATAEIKASPFEPEPCINSDIRDTREG